MLKTQLERVMRLQGFSALQHSMLFGGEKGGHAIGAAVALGRHGEEARRRPAGRGGGGGGARCTVESIVHMGLKTQALDGSRCPHLATLRKDSCGLRIAAIPGWHVQYLCARVVRTQTGTGHGKMEFACQSRVKESSTVEETFAGAG